MGVALTPLIRSSHSLSTLAVSRRLSSAHFLQLTPQLSVAHYGGTDYQPKSVGPISTVHLRPVLTTFSVPSLEDAMLKALPTLFPHLLGAASGARGEFYDKFQREADEYDRDFMKKYDEDLNTTLIFVGVFLFNPSPS